VVINVFPHHLAQHHPDQSSPLGSERHP
jgi:hypothetical protein